MNASDLKNFIPELQQQTFVGASDSRIRSLARIYFALYNLVSVNALGEEYGKEQVYMDKLQTLFDILQRRTEMPVDLHRKAELYNQLALMSYNLPFLINETNEERLWEQSQDVIDTYIADYRSNTQSEQSLYTILHLILVQWSGYVEDGEDFPLPLAFLHEQLENWMEEWKVQHAWASFSVNESLQRLILLAKNSYLMNNRDYDADLPEIYRGCIEQHLSETKNSTKPTSPEASLRRKILLLEVIQQHLVTDESHQLALSQLTTALAEELDSYSQGSDAYWEALSYGIEYSSCELSQEFQQKCWVEV